MYESTKYYRGERNEVARLLPNSYSKVLEIGCGEGGFRTNLTEQNEYWGVEPEENVAKAAEANLDNVLVGTYQEVEPDLPDDYFDLIICNDVIEHMPNHDYFLDDIKNKLANNGRLVISIPNVRYVWNLYELLIRKDWKYRELGILDRTHLRFFTRKSLIRTLLEHNYVIEELSGINNYKWEGFIKGLPYILAISILGKDIKYLQFGARVKKQ